MLRTSPIFQSIYGGRYGKQRFLFKKDEGDVR
jgi:hypothetical protein